MFEVLFFGVCAHYIGDFPLQGDFVAMNKGKYWYVMLAHCIIWAACICVVLKFYGLFAPWKIAALIIPHYLTDLWKCRKPKTPEAWKYIYPDQAIHLLQVVGVCLA